VLGKSYVPNTTLKPMRQRGIASWYGKKFHGQKTSIGERYDMFAMTAAHPTLALPSYARVTNLDNGKSVVVRVIDRGPFHAGRIIDLSYAAAHRLDYIDKGSARVEVETLLPTDSTSPLRAPAPAPVPLPRLVTVKPQHEAFDQLMTQLAREMDAKDERSEVVESAVSAGRLGSVFLQLGAFSSADNAESLRARLARELDWLTESIRVEDGGDVYRVQLGPYGSRSNAERIAERIRAMLGYEPSFVVR
jgi:rare lipoprotein A